MANSNQGGNQGNNQGNGGGTSNRGFASMDADKQREIAAEGGRAAHASGNAHEFDSKEAREAGSHSHDNTGSGSQGGSASSGGGKSGGNNASGGGSGTRGGSSEQHAQAGRQSHKNS